MIRILTCNLFSDRVDGGRLAAFAESKAVDVLCVQEHGEALDPAISRVLPYGRCDADPAKRGLGIFCRRPADVSKLGLPGRDAYVARLSSSEWPSLATSIEIVNIHFFAPHTWPYFPRRARRRDQLAGLLAYVDQSADRPHAILGDFNATPIWPVYRKLASRYADAAMQTFTRPDATWPNLRASWLPGLLRIDHCFVSSGVRCKRANVVEIPGSDHFGLCVDLAVDLPPRSPRGR